MWGSDYPHIEATTPYTREALRLTFGGVDPAETTKMLTTNVARFYHFDVAALRPLADQWCPTKGEVFEKLDFSTVPEDASKCPGLAPHTQLSR